MSIVGYSGVGRKRRSRRLVVMSSNRTSGPGTSESSGWPFMQEKTSEFLPYAYQIRVFKEQLI
jgi:hypothetical protein